MRPAPRVWALTSEKAGDNAQVLAVARSLGWPFEVKALRHRGLDHFRHRLLGPGLRSLEPASAAALAPPWPDLVIAMGRRQAPVALWIRARSGGRAKLVQLGRPRIDLARFDLVVVPPQFRIPARPNVVRLTLPLARPDPAAIDRAVASWRARIEALPPPRTVLLVGGPAVPYVLDETVARRMMADGRALLAREGGSLVILASRRTPAAVARVLDGERPAAGFFWPWSPQGENPYLACLALAERFVVTGDSASMLAEVAQQGKPLAIYDLPRRPSAAYRLYARLAGWLHEEAAPYRRRLAADLLDRTGLLSYSRDLAAFHRALLDRGLAVRFGQPFPASAAPPPDEAARVARRIVALMGW